jgi:NTP pyrophosphatase (non-canonical NTP hydrolase)
MSEEFGSRYHIEFLKTHQDKEMGEHGSSPSWDAYAEMQAEALTWRAVAERYRDAQKAVAVATQQRGYRDGWTDEQFLARQIVKLQEELGEMAFPVWGVPHGLMAEIENIRANAQEVFDLVDPAAWDSVDIAFIEEMKSEAADCLVVLFNIAAVLEQMTGKKFDLVQEAVKKAEADINRGVRK